MKRLPTKRAVHLHNLTSDSLAFALDYDNGAGGGLGLGGSHALDVLLPQARAARNGGAGGSHLVHRH
jgi:hypothetical protein